MISWIQINFQKHFRTVFAVLLGVTIISFIVTIGASPGLGRADRRIYTREFFGINLGSPDGQARVFGDAKLSSQLLVGYVPEDAQLQQYAFSRQAALALADQLGIPAGNSGEIMEYIRNLRAFANENGAFDVSRYNQFRETIRKNPQITEADVSRVISENVRVEKVEKILGGPGFVLPGDVRNQLDRMETSWTLGVAKVDYASFNPTIKPTEAQITKYYEDNKFRYEIPNQVAVRYAEFSAADFMNGINPSDEEIRAYYDANPARFPNPADKPGATPSATNANDYAKVKPIVAISLKMEKASRLAAKAASELSLALYEQHVAFGSPEFERLLAAHKVTLKDAKPLARGVSDPALGDNPQIADEAFKLNSDRYFSDAIATNEGSVVLFWKENIAAHQPMLAEVHDKVAADFTETEKHKLFIELGRSLRAQLDARLKTGEPLDKAAEAVGAAAGVKIEGKMHPAFSLRQRPQDLDYTVLMSLENLKAHEVSEMSVGQDNSGSIIYVADKKQPDLSETNPEFASLNSRISAGLASSDSTEYLMDIVQRELSKSAPARP